MDWWEIGRSLLVFVVIPMAVWLYRRIDLKIEEIDKRVAVQEAKHEVLSERVSNMRNDLAEIKSMLRELLTRANG